MAERSWVEWLWWGTGRGARAARTMLAPASAVFAVIVRVRNAMYDRRALRVHTPRMPVVSVGNLTVGGTGKTPVSSWLATQLQERGARPAIILRGYGDDEPLVHQKLTPSIRVIANPDRVEAIEWAANSGADVAVLDDAFQHRRVARDADVVLISADASQASARLLPAGPYREPWDALRRASLVIVTRKAVKLDQAREVAAQARAVAPNVPVAIMHLAFDAVIFRDRPPMSPAALRGRIVLAIAGVANGLAFGAQLLDAGALVRFRLFPDHHPFTAAEVEAIARDVSKNVIPLCTLKDAVKVFPLWPREAPAIGYVSQAVIIEERGESIDALLELVVNARLRQL